MKWRLTASAVAFACMPLVSNALTLECRIGDLGAGGGYITEVYVFQLDESAGKAFVADGLIQYIYDAPIPAKVADDTEKKLVFTWIVRLTNSSAQQLKMQFRASYFKETRKLTVRASPGGTYSNDFEGRGTCKAN